MKLRPNPQLRPSFAVSAGWPETLGAIAKVSGLLLGLVFALFASPIITWVQTL